MNTVIDGAVQRTPRSNTGGFLFLVLSLLTLVGCASYKVRPEDHQAYILVVDSLKSANGEIDRSLVGSDHAVDVKAVREEVETLEREIGEVLENKELERERVDALRAKLAAFKQDSLRLVEAACSNGTDYHLTESSSRALQTWVTRAHRAIDSIDGRLAQFVEKQRLARLENARGATKAVGLGLLALETKLFERLDDKAKKHPEQKDELDARKGAWVQRVRSWMVVTQQALESAASSGTIGAALIQSEPLSEALEATLGEDWGTNQQLALGLVLLGLNEYLPTGQLSPEAVEVLSAVRGAFAEVLRDFDQRHPS